MGVSNKFLFLLGLGVIGYLTNPDKQQFDKQLQERTKRDQGFFASLAMKGASALNFFDIKNYYIFSLAFLNDPQKPTPRLVGLGLFTKWIFNDQELQ